MAGQAAKGVIDSLDKTGIFGKIGKDFGYFFYPKTKREKARTKIVQVLGKARDLIDQCGVGEGLNEDSVQWLVGVGEVIQDWGSIADAPADVPKEWTTLTEDIRKKFGGKLRESSHSSTSNWYTIGRRSTKISEKVEGLIKHYSDDIKKGIEGGNVHRPLPRSDFPYHREFQAFECRTETVDMVISSIYDDQYEVTQIFGPGGIGKTTMLIEIAKRIEKGVLDSKTGSKKFQRVVYVEVSREPDICVIQDKIVTQLGTQPLKNDQQHKRASDLQEEINRIGEVLVILDDVWTRLDMETIWKHSSNVKVLVGTRKRDLKWNKENKIPVHSLSDEDSWSLFKQEAGIDETSEVVRTAKKVKSECHGLPLALAVIGRALSGKAESTWKSSLTYLESTDPTVKCCVQDYLYKIIKYSYDHLPNEISKKMFLYCCLFPDKEKVKEVDLKRYLVGEDIDGFGTTKEKEDLDTSVQTLEYYSLMEKTNEPGILKMHDVIKDAAVYIANEENFALILCGTANEETVLKKKAFCQLKRMSVMRSNINNVDDGPDCLKLQTLLIRWNQRIVSLPNNFFQNMKVLAVLDLSYSEISSLPGSMKHLKKLRTLLLNGCRNLHDIEVIVHLKGLRVLSLKECAVKVLPKGMSNLVALIVLDLSTAQDVLTVTDLFKGLPLLESLSMALESITVDIFIQISKLKRLTYVNLYVETSVLTSNGIQTIDGLSNWFNFTIYNHPDCPLGSGGKNLSIKKLESVSPVVKLLLQEAENITIEKCFKKSDKYLTESAGGSKFEKTKILQLTECDNIEYLCPKDCSTLEELEVIQLKKLKELIGIFEGTVSNESFAEVREILISSCEKMVSVIPDNVLQKVHRGLQKIRVTSCVSVTSIFHPEGDHIDQLFKALTSIQLEDLNNLQRIWHGTPPIGTFANLVEIIVKDCHSLNSLFTSDLAAMLRSLQKLTVENNEALTEIVSTGPRNDQAFPRVSHLSLQKLPKLIHFTNSPVNLKWPLLVRLKLGYCNALTRFPMAESSAPHMTRVDLASESDRQSPWYRGLQRLEKEHFKIRYEVCRALPLYYLVLVKCLSDAL